MRLSKAVIARRSVLPKQSIMTDCFAALAMTTGLFLAMTAFACPLHALESFQLSDPGTETIVRYGAYGVFTGTGTPSYRYYVSDREGLAKAVGEGVYPNVQGLLQDPVFRAMQSH